MSSSFGLATLWRHSGGSATYSHEQNLFAFMKRNIEKMKLRVRILPFMGHIATDKGLCVDPRKVRGIIEMSRPTDVAGV